MPRRQSQGESVALVAPVGNANKCSVEAYSPSTSTPLIRRTRQTAEEVLQCSEGVPS